MIRIAIDEPDRQLLLLALATLARERPGWDWTLGRVAEILEGRAMYDQFKEINADRPPPSGGTPP